MMDEARQAIIHETFRVLIDDAERGLIEAEVEHKLAMAREIDPDDPEDAAFVQQERAEWAAQVYAYRRIVDALIMAELIALREEPSRCAA